MNLDNETLLYGLIIGVLLLVSAFFSAAETALTAISRPRLFQLVMDGNRRARIASHLRRHKESLIGSILLGNNIVNIAASAIATSFTIRLFGDSEEALVIVTLVMTFLVVVFSEILPKTYAIHNAERVSLALAPLIQLIVKLLFPITHGIQMLIRLPLQLFGTSIREGETLISGTDLIRGTIELHHREGAMIKQERDMLGSILDLNDIEVKDIMVHRTRVETLSADLPAAELAEKAFGTLHSRVPIWKGEADNIIGVLHVKTLVKTLHEYGGRIDNEQITAICHKPWFIPETTTLRDQLLAFRSRRQHLAFVVDEYGAWLGIVTLEDIIEEIVGDIEDEHDETSHLVQKMGEDIYLVNGNVTVRDLNRHLDWNLPDEHASTVAGLLLHAAEGIPPVGESHTVDGFILTAVEKTSRHITRLRIEKLPQAAPPEQDAAP